MYEASDYDKFVESHGHQILGTYEYALSLSDALEALELAKTAGLPIVGGDVYVRRSETIDFAYSNWSINSRQGENATDYANRTWKETDKYLRRYPKGKGEEPLFVLVRKK
jgi:hypothetical protein